MSKKLTAMNVFESVMNSKRAEVVGWLCARYKGLREEDSEDIVQESSMELWKKVHECAGMKITEVVVLWKTIARNRYTHWLRAQRFSEEWDDSRLQYGWEERDFSWDRGNWEKQMKREALYDYIDHLNEKDRQLMLMVLLKKSMSEIAKALGYSNIQVAKNRKCKILSIMKKQLPKSSIFNNGSMAA